MRSDCTNGGHWFLSGPVDVVHASFKSLQKATKPIASLAIDAPTNLPNC